DRLSAGQRRRWLGRQGQAAHPCTKAMKAKQSKKRPLRKVDSRTVVLGISYKQIARNQIGAGISPTKGGRGL
ncbi:hypothetical protein, partial [Mesorhizobium sp. M4A.F.Ca.ET.050.02.1.1]|uniref:hypothetical protein n=1 Tax=Mesorhizobium sp. M4A.F.Ca.ET.050.02.1.1 TaxID=2496754 RepID=UPI001AECDF4C